MIKQSKPMANASRQPTCARGFTLLEIVMVVAIIALLAAVAIPLYSSYIARSQAAELALKYDAIRTHMQVAAKTGEVRTACADLADMVPPANLQSEYSNLGIGFEPVTGGYTPVLTMCATSAKPNQHGVEVTREAHEILGRNGNIGQGAVVGASAVSFTVKLAGDAALCKTLPPQTPGGCNPNQATQTAVVLPPNIPASAASAPAVIPQPRASNPATVTAANTPTCTRGPAGPVDRQAMRFQLNNRVTSSQNLNTGGDMTALTAEVVVTGDTKNDPLATLLSYSTDTPFRGFSLFDPSNLHISLASMSYRTGVNIEDGKPHRLTVSWQQSGGTLVLYDNGREVWRRGGVNEGGTVAGNGRLTIGQEDDSALNGSPYYRDGYAGTIVNAALANKAVNAGQAASGPLHTVFGDSNGLVTDVVMGPDGKPTDLTQRTPYTATSGVSAQGAAVQSSIYRDRDCK